MEYKRIKIKLFTLDAGTEGEDLYIFGYQL
jgi:hypothetical protein